MRALTSTWIPLAGTGQAAALACDDGIDVLVTGIGGGKTDVGAFKTLRWALEHPKKPDGQPADYLVLGPDYKVVRRVQLEAIAEMMDKTPLGREGLLKGRIVGGNDPRIHLRNGVTIYGKSGRDPDALRNYEFDGLWMDEAAVQTEAAFAIGLSRQRHSTTLRAIVTSSPRPNWLWRVVRGVTGNDEDCQDEAYKRALQFVDIRIFRWDSRSNRTTTGSTLDGIGAILEAADSELSAQELGGLFVGIETDREEFRNYETQIGGKAHLTALQAHPLVLGVDLGQHKDYTWLTIMSQTGVVLWMRRFNQGDVPEVPKDKFYPYVQEEVLDVCQRWNVKIVRGDTAMHGQSFFQTLMNRERARVMGLKVEGYRTDSPGKRDSAIEAISTACGMKSFRCPSTWVGPDHVSHKVGFTDELKKEIRNLQCERVGKRRKYKHIRGQHDDGVVSVALAYLEILDRPPAVLRDYSGFRSFRAPRPGGSKSFKTSHSASRPGSTGGGFIGLNQRLGKGRR